jgi:dimeric dUTPase (all-alpha-NTP-PPase superfamily)
MAINLQPLFEKQRQLDEYIVKTKGLEGQDLLPNKILALQVELGELANEWRGFKHWSDDREPRREKMLEEYVDCLHFMISIGLEIHAQPQLAYTPEKDETVLQQIQHMFGVVRLCYANNQWQWSMAVFLGLGEMLGFTWEEIEAAYNAKWQENIRRQQTGY